MLYDAMHFLTLGKESMLYFLLEMRIMKVTKMESNQWRRDKSAGSHIQNNLYHRYF